MSLFEAGRGVPQGDGGPRGGMGWDPQELVSQGKESFLSQEGLVTALTLLPSAP